MNHNTTHTKFQKPISLVIIYNKNMGLKGFVEGGTASVVAGCTTHPLDLIKVRMQLQGEKLPLISTNPQPIQSLRPAFSFPSHSSTLNLPQPTVRPRTGPLSLGVRIVQTEGAAALFSGVSAAVLRQTLYSTTRMDLYDMLKQKWTDQELGKMLLLRKIATGLIARGTGAAVGNPADVAMVCMQADGRLPAAQRRNYKGVLDAITQMSRQEGIGSLWRGLALTVNRAMIVTAS